MSHGAGWREPCASTDRDKRWRWLWRLVSRKIGNEELGGTNVVVQIASRGSPVAKRPLQPEQCRGTNLAETGIRTDRLSPRHLGKSGFGVRHREAKIGFRGFATRAGREANRRGRMSSQQPQHRCRRDRKTNVKDEPRQRLARAVRQHGS